jgi:hypothetical protein
MPSFDNNPNIDYWIFKRQNYLTAGYCNEMENNIKLYSLTDDTRSISRRPFIAPPTVIQQFIKESKNQQLVRKFEETCETCHKTKIFFAKSTFFHAGQREKKSFFPVEITFFHAGITFFHAGKKVQISRIWICSTCFEVDGSLFNLLRTSLWARTSE